MTQVLWPECGWQPVSLTDLITAASVKKVYRKATLCIHPDKVQQKGATLQQKYIAEKVFDLLKVLFMYLFFLTVLFYGRSKVKYECWEKAWWDIGKVKNLCLDTNLLSKKTWSLYLCRYYLSTDFSVNFEFHISK